MDFGRSKFDRSSQTLVKKSIVRISIIDIFTYSFCLTKKMHSQKTSFLQSLKSQIPTNIKESFFVSKDGFREPILSHLIAHSIFRFWVYPSYWSSLFIKIFGKLGKAQPNIELQGDREFYLTGVPNPHAGIGHQLCNWNAALIFAKKYNLKFVHHPLLSKLKESKWEKFLNFGDGEFLYDDIVNDNSIEILKLPRIWWDREDKQGDRVVNEIISEIINSADSGKKILFHLDYDQSVYDYTSVREILREKYWNNRNKHPISLDWQQNTLHIAAHIRRGDVMKMNKTSKNFQQRWLDNSYFINIIKKIKEILPDRQISIHVFSQGNITDFQEFKTIDSQVIYHLDEDEYQTFHSMIVADILLLSPSSFSYFAGLISDGIKIATYPWLHEIPENSEWIRTDKNCNFNPSALSERFGNK